MAGQYEVDQVGQRQDIADIVFNIRADETPFSSMCGKRPRPLKKLTTWQVEDYPAPAPAGVMDGQDVTTFEKVSRDLLTGVAQKFRRPWFVSDFADVTDVAGLPSGEKGRQKAAAATVLKLMLEARCLSALECSVDNGTDTPNAMRGAFLWLDNDEQSLYPVPTAFRPGSANNISVALSALTETAFIAALEAAYKEKRGKLSLDGFVGIELKGRMDNWTARDTEASASAYPVRTFNQDAKNMALIKTVDFYNFSAGQVRLHPSSHIQLDIAGAATAYTHKSGVFVHMPAWRLGFMRNPGMKDLPDLGGGPRGFSDAIAVLECGNPLGQITAEINS